MSTSQKLSEIMPETEPYSICIFTESKKLHSSTLEHLVRDKKELLSIRLIISIFIIPEDTVRVS